MNGIIKLQEGLLVGAIKAKKNLVGHALIPVGIEPSLIVTVTKNTDNTLSADKTNQEIYEAFQKGIYIEARRPDLAMVYKLYDAPNASTASFVSTMMDGTSGSVIGYDTIKIDSNAVTYQSVNSSVLIGTTDDLTPAQVSEAVLAGRPVKVQYTSDIYGAISFMAFNVATAASTIISQILVFSYGEYGLAILEGGIDNGEWFLAPPTVLAEKKDIPTVPESLKNPNALTIKIGSSTVTYDGSTAETVEIADGSEVEY